MGSPDPKTNVKRAGDDKDKLAMLRELAKLTKPTGKTAKGEAEPDKE